MDVNFFRLGMTKTEIYMFIGVIEFAKGWESEIVWGLILL